MIIYTVFDSNTREDLYRTWSFEAMLDYRNLVYTERGIITFIRYCTFNEIRSTKVELTSNRQINYGRMPKLNIRGVM